MVSLRLYLIILVLVFVTLASAISLIYLYRQNNELDHQQSQLQQTTVDLGNYVAKQTNAQSVTKFLPSEELPKMAQQHKLNGLQIKVGTKKPTNVKDNDVQVLVTPIHLQFSAVQDADIFRFIGQIKAVFPGYILPRKLSLSKQEEVNNSTIDQIKEGYKPDLVRGEYVFDWVDFQETEAK